MEENEVLNSSQSASSPLCLKHVVAFDDQQVYDFSLEDVLLEELPKKL